jgi:hypothetical protein
VNLHNIVAPVIAAVNPWITGIWLQSNGYSTGPAGRQYPSYLAPVSVSIQMQPMTWKELQMVDGLNLNGEQRGMYVNGPFAGVDRAAIRGGDLIQLPDGTKWLVTMLLENFTPTAGWVKCAVVKQTH